MIIVISIIVILIHLVICLADYMLSKAGVLLSGRLAVSMAMLVPVWGTLCLFVLEIRARLKRDTAKEVGIEKLLLNDEVHRSILMDEEPDADMVVPLEEAMAVNDVSTRRGLMMEVMYANPADYVSQLQSARMNDDTEVVHYAVTALTELQKEYDLEFQKLERALALDPDDDKTLNDLIDLSEKQLSSGLLEGNARNMRLRSYGELLDRRLKKVQTLALWGKKIDTDLKLGEYDRANEGICQLLESWPQDERGYLYRIRYYAALKNREGIDRTMEEIREKNIYLTPSGRSEVMFWSKGGGAEDQ